jgi:hypothetical protein
MEKWLRVNMRMTIWKRKNLDYLYSFIDFDHGRWKMLLMHMVG